MTEDTLTRSARKLYVLALNSGSSSLKFGLYRVCANNAALIITGEAEAIGEAASAFHAKDAHGVTLVEEKLSIASQQAAVVPIKKLLTERKMPMPHRANPSSVSWRPMYRVD